MTNIMIVQPKEGEWFEIEPKSIKRSFFGEKMSDSKQEWTRQIICDAFIQMDSNTEKYCRPFETMMPEKTWSNKTVEELKDLASDLGDHMADWVEQALEWAQRISNGETWESVCNEPDTSNWFRLVVWKNDHLQLVGGTRKYKNSYPASDVSHYGPKDRLNDTVPLVVRYK